jgi:hypothetical protein
MLIARRELNEKRREKERSLNIKKNQIFSKVFERKLKFIYYFLAENVKIYGILSI